MSSPLSGTLPSLLPDDEERSKLLQRIHADAGRVTGAVLESMDQLEWFSGLDADSRSWISLMARSGVDGFLTWFAGEPFAAEAVFHEAPRALAGRISLQQTVQLVKVITDVVEEEISDLVPEQHRALAHLGCLHFSRDVAFAAAGIYAHAAEQRGAWDSRLEASVVDAVVRAETDESVLSRASTLGWDPEATVAVVIGGSPEGNVVASLRRAARKLDLDALAAVQGDRLVCVLGGAPLTDPMTTVSVVDQLADFFAAGPVVVGPLAESLAGAPESARAAASGFRAARAWPEGPRTMLSADLLPERALAGDGHARRTLGTDVYSSLQRSPELLDTCVAFLAHGASVEATARALFVHPNTVRYRMKRIQDATGYNPTDPREAFVLQMAVALGRLQE